MLCYPARRSDVAFFAFVNHTSYISSFTRLGRSQSRTCSPSLCLRCSRPTTSNMMLAESLSSSSSRLALLLTIFAIFQLLLEVSSSCGHWSLPMRSHLTPWNVFSIIRICYAKIFTSSSHKIDVCINPLFQSEPKYPWWGLPRCIYIPDSWHVPWRHM